MVDPSTMAFDLTWDVPKSLVEALELGRRVLESEPKKEKEKEKGKGKGKAKEEGTVDLLGKELAEVRLEVRFLVFLSLLRFCVLTSSHHSVRKPLSTNPSTLSILSRRFILYHLPNLSNTSCSFSSSINTR